ncbi:MAG: hypothetical protein WBO34_00420 [Gammaproteobacteria bacterium]
MSYRHINMRLNCTYEGDENTIATLEVEHEVDAQWQPLDLRVTTPGFDIFVYAVFHCQHTYFRINCAERKLLLGSAEGHIVIGAGEDWNLESLRVHFSGTLEHGQPGPGDVDYIVSRMTQCPVSRNIQTPSSAETTVTLE